MTTTVVKLVASVVMFIGTLLAGLGARKTVQWLEKYIKMAAVNCISCGVFCSLLFCEFLSELMFMETEFKKKYTSQIFENIPFAAFSMFIGLCFMLASEKIVHGDGHHHCHSHSHQSKEDDHEVHYPTSDQFTDRTSIQLESISSVQNFVNKKNMGVGLLVLGMAIHSFLEGTPVGVKNDEAAIWTVAIPLLFHKLMESAALSSQLSELSTKTSLLVIGTYSAMTPFGVMLGAVLTDFEESFVKDLATMLLLGFSAGVLIFIAFVEMLGDAMNSSDLSGSCLLFYLALGFVLLTGVLVGSKSILGDHE